jgi:translation initiation factor 3 subunit E
LNHQTPHHADDLRSPLATTLYEHAKSRPVGESILHTIRHAIQPPSMAHPNGASDATDIVEQYDLLPKMIPYLDKHLLYPLVADRSQGEDDKDNMKLRFVLLKDTNMTDYVADLDTQIKGLSEKPAEYTKKREEVLKKRDVFEEETATIRGLLEDADVVGNLRSDKVANLAYLKEQHNVTPEMVNQLYEYGQFEYSCGSYQSAGELLYQFRVLVRLPPYLITSSTY